MSVQPGSPEPQFIAELQRIHADALYGKKKHANAADRTKQWHHRFGIPVVVLSVVLSSVFFYMLRQGDVCIPKEIAAKVGAALGVIAAILSGLQTFFDFGNRSQGHASIAGRYLKIQKAARLAVVGYRDGMLDAQTTWARLEELRAEYDNVTQEAQSFPPSPSDYRKAQAGISAGEEKYEDGELGD